MADLLLLVHLARKSKAKAPKYSPSPDLGHARLEDMSHITSFPTLTEDGRATSSGLPIGCKSGTGRSVAQANQFSTSSQQLFQTSKYNDQDCGLCIGESTGSDRQVKLTHRALRPNYIPHPSTLKSSCTSKHRETEENDLREFLEQFHKCRMISAQVQNAKLQFEAIQDYLIENVETDEVRHFLIDLEIIFVKAKGLPTRVPLLHADSRIHLRTSFDV